MHILILGTGSIGERHLRNFLRIDGTRCSIAEPNAKMLERATRDYSVVNAFKSWEEADMSDYDGVVICTPTNLHVPIMTQLVRAGANVLSEKPISMTPDGIDDLLAAVAAKNVVTGVAFCMRHDPLLEEIRERIHSGALGAVRVANFYAGQYWPSMRKGWPPAYAQSRETGGGAIADHLVHMINLLEWYFGPVASVSGFQRHMELPGIPTEDYATVTLRFEGGQVGQLNICLFQRDTGMRLQVVGDAGTARMERDAERLDIYVDEETNWTTGSAAGVDRDDVFMRQAQHFIGCIRGEAEARCTVNEAVNTLRVVLAAMESSDGDSRFIDCGAAS